MNQQQLWLQGTFLKREQKNDWFLVNLFTHAASSKHFCEQYCSLAFEPSTCHNRSELPYRHFKPGPFHSGHIAIVCAKTQKNENEKWKILKMKMKNDKFKKWKWKMINFQSFFFVFCQVTSKIKHCNKSYRLISE